MEKTKYKLLITKDSLDNLRNPSEISSENIKNFLFSLIRGEWEILLETRDPILQQWIYNDTQRILFSSHLSGSIYAIWEPVSTIDLKEYLEQDPSQTQWKTEYFLSPHIIIYLIDEFPGNPQTHLVLSHENLTFEKETEVRTIDRNKFSSTISYNNELYYLSPYIVENLLDLRQIGLPLYLTPEQAQVIGYYQARPSPILLSGEAGSGKTSVITHWLLVNHVQDITRGKRQLFVTFSPKLVELTRTMFDNMLPLAEKRENVECLTYRKLLFEKIAGLGGLSRFDEKTEMTFTRFLREYSPRHIPPKMDAVLVWDEIRSVIKGNANTSKKLMDFKTYKDLKEERGRCKTPEDMRKDYYEATLTYQNYLEREGLWDSIDLAYFCISRMKEQPQKFRYDWIACDETQDLAPIEIEVLIGLLKDQRIDNIFFTGDIAQVINPSGFNWAQLKAALWYYHSAESGHIKDAWHLQRNFRSSVEIVNLVNEVLEIRRGFLGDLSERHKQISYKKGDSKPMVLRSDPLEIIGDLVSNPKARLILVKNQSQKLKLENELSRVWTKNNLARQATVLTVEEAKGLEWDGVLLWNFFLPRHEVISKDEWENVFIHQKRESLKEQILKGEKSRYGLSYEFNLLHVGLTRGKKHLFIFDEHEDKNILNLGDSINEYVDIVDVEYFKTKWVTNPPKAIEIEDNAYNICEKDLSQGKLMYIDAAREYTKVGDLIKAAECYEKAEKYDLAADCYKKHGNIKGEKVSMAKFFENDLNHRKAGEFWLEIAQLCSNSDTPIFDINDSIRFYNKAKENFHRTQQFEKAADAGKEEAKCHNELRSKLEVMSQAAKDYERSGKNTKAIEMLSGISIKGKGLDRDYLDGISPPEFLGKNLQKLAVLKTEEEKIDWEEIIGIMMDAAQYFYEATKEITLKKESFFKNQKNCIEQATNWYLTLGKVREAVRYRKDFLLKIENDEESRELFKSLDMESWWRNIISILTNNEMYSSVKEEIIEFAEHLESVGYFEEALEELVKKSNWLKEKGQLDFSVNLLRKIAEIYRKRFQWEKAAKVWFEIAEIQSKSEDRLTILLAIDSFRDAGHYFLRVDNYGKANECFIRGKELGLREMSKLNVGMYCMKEVALDNWVPAIYRITNIQDRTYLVDFLKEWVNFSVTNFAFEIPIAIRRLKGYINKLERESIDKFKSKIDKIQIIWLRFCLTLVLEKFLLKNPQSKTITELKDEYNLIQETIPFLKAQEIDELPTDSSLDIHESINIHWDLISEYFQNFKNSGVLEKKF